MITVTSLAEGNSGLGKLAEEGHLRGQGDSDVILDLTQQRPCPW